MKLMVQKVINPLILEDVEANTKSMAAMTVTYESLKTQKRNVHIIVDSTAQFGEEDEFPGPKTNLEQAIRAVLGDLYKEVFIYKTNGTIKDITETFQKVIIKYARGSPRESDDQFLLWLNFEESRKGGIPSSKATSLQELQKERERGQMLYTTRKRGTYPTNKGKHTATCNVPERICEGSNPRNRK